MVWLAVTRAGWGDVLEFDSRTDAYLHPIVQPGDALLGSPQDLVAEYNQLEWLSLAALAGVSLPQLDVAVCTSGSPRDFRAVAERTSEWIWSALLTKASRPSEDPSAIINIIRADRRSTTVVAKKQVQATEAAAAANTEKAPAGPKVGTTGPRGISKTSTIHMLKDKTGKNYGPDNNPKKVGSAGHERFARYVDGMTVEAALAAGIWSADITWDIGKGFIEVRPAAGVGTKSDGTEASDAEVAAAA